MDARKDLDDWLIEDSLLYIDNDDAAFTNIYNHVPLAGEGLNT